MAGIMCRPLKQKDDSDEQISDSAIDVYGGWQKALGIMQGNVSCGDPTVWDAYLVRKGNRE